MRHPSDPNSSQKIHSKSTLRWSPNELLQIKHGRPISLEELSSIDMGPTHNLMDLYKEPTRKPGTGTRDYTKIRLQWPSEEQPFPLRAQEESPLLLRGRSSRINLPLASKKKRLVAPVKCSERKKKKKTFIWIGWLKWSPAQEPTQIPPGLPMEEEA